MKSLIIFDLDGTLLDTSSGIIHCYHKAGQTLGLEKNPVDNEKFVIGGPLNHGFEYLYKIKSEAETQEAVALYKKAYQSDGINMFEIYSGIENTIRSLKLNGYLIAVATLKLESYAKKMLRSAGIADYFDVIYGWDGTEKCTKSFILTKVLQTLNIMPTAALLVGDSEYDSKGAKEAGVDFLGVTYGFGIHKDDSVPHDYPVVDSPNAVIDYIVLHY